MVCNYFQKEFGLGDVHRLNQHLAQAIWNVKPCLKFSGKIKVEMQGHIHALIGRILSSELDENQIPNFEDSFYFIVMIPIQSQIK